MRSPGFVYVMTNPRLPGVVKVGKTTRPPEDSAREGTGPGVSELLHVRDAAYFSDYDAAESFVHEYLATFRDPKKSEYFEVPVEIAMRALSLAMERHVGTRTARQHDPTLYDNDPAPDNSQSATELYEQGTGVRAQNPTEAMQVLKRAARLGEPRAFVALAEMHEKGEGLPPNPKRAIEWLEEGTRSNARECWGALADRYEAAGANNSASYNQAHACVRSFFDGMDLVSISDDHLAPTLLRLRLYFKVAKMQLDAADERLVPKVLDGLRTRIQHQGNEAARRSQLAAITQLSNDWLVVSGKKKSSSLGGAAKVLFGAMLLGGVAIFVVPTAKQIFLKTPPADASGALKTPADADVKTDSATPKTVAAKSKSKQSAKSRQAAKVETSSAASAKPIIRDASPEPAPVATAWVTKTPPPLPEPVTKEQLSAQQLTDHFEVNKERASAAFKNETVRISDIVTKVGKRDVSFKKVKCKFDGPPPASLAEGQSVTVEGTVHGKGFWTGTVALDHCRILP